MKIIIHNHGESLAIDFQKIAVERLERLSRFSIPIERIDVDVKHEANPRFGKSSHRVVLTSHGSGPLLRAEGSGFNDLADLMKRLKLLNFNCVSAMSGVKI